MENFEEALRNIDIFCRILVKKIVEDESCSQNIVVEPIENLLRRKYIIEESLESKPSTRYLIPLTQAEEPLIDVFEDENYVKIFLQCHCKDQKVTIHTDLDGLEICTKECQKLNLPVEHLQIENMIVRCNNEVLEIGIPKTKTTISYGN
ncbi:hypothetical protein IBX35_02840 [Candidatus Bathyarchaeota archaeon]|nr:hypothetical protein [Candidatus Bathyarchaeota archaeon]